MGARAEAQRLLRPLVSASRSASRSAPLSGRGQPPALDSEPGATLPLLSPLLFGKQSAQGAYARRREGSLPVRAGTLGPVGEANRARSGTDTPNHVPATRLEIFIDPMSPDLEWRRSAGDRWFKRRDLALYSKSTGEPHPFTWLLCSCGVLLAVPDESPAVGCGCPICLSVN